jgi:hypothetical protein
MFLGITPVSSVSNGLYFPTLPLVSVMCVIYTSKGMSNKIGVRVIYWKIWYTILYWWKRLNRGTCYFVCVLFWLLHKEVIVLSASSTVYIYERDENGVKGEWVCIVTSLGLWSEWSAHNSLSVLDDVYFILRDVKQMLTECIDIWIINVFI